jgi:hypothetical protein
MSNDEDRLEEWVQSVQPMIMHVEAYQVPQEVKLDFSLASLCRLEEVVLDRFDDAEDLDDEDEQGLVLGATAYLGETLMRVAGGSWIWEADSEIPVIRADAELGLAPLSPRQLLAAAVDRRDGERLTAACAAWSAAVHELAAQRPSWCPVKQPTPGLDRIQPSDSAQTTMNQWLQQRSAGFTGWVARYTPPGTSWDFSPESLDALEALVHRVAPSDEALQDPRHRDFADGAAWYLGEVMRRGIGGRWLSLEDEHNPSAGIPAMDLSGPRVRVITPSVYLRIALEHPGFLRARFVKFSS